GAVRALRLRPEPAGLAAGPAGEVVAHGTTIRVRRDLQHLGEQERLASPVHHLTQVLGAYPLRRCGAARHGEGDDERRGYRGSVARTTDAKECGPAAVPAAPLAPESI